MQFDEEYGPQLRFEPFFPPNRNARQNGQGRGVVVAGGVGVVDGDRDGVAGQGAVVVVGGGVRVEGDGGGLVGGVVVLDGGDGDGLGGVPGVGGERQRLGSLRSPVTVTGSENSN